MLITNFAGGEVSQNLFGRIDLPIYQMSVSRLENFDIMTSGGITRRSGTKRLGKLKGQARLIPFTVNESLSFIFEIGDEYIRTWKNGSLLTKADEAIEFVSTSEIPLYKKAELRDIQTVQTHDSLYLVHRHYKPYVIKWQGNDTFTLSTLAVTGNAHKVPFEGQENYPGCIALFAGRLIFASSTREPQRVWASKVFEYENFTYFDTVVSKSQQLKNPDLRVFSAKAVKGSTTLTAVTKDFTGIEHIERYYVSANRGVPSGTKVVSVTSDTITLSNAVTIDKEDMVLSIHLWKNVNSPTAEDYEQKELINNVTHPAHAFSFELGSDKIDAIKWLACAQDLIIATESSEWIMKEGVSAVNVQVQLQSRYGSSSFQATLIGQHVMYIGSGGHSVKNYAYDYEQRTYKSIDLTQAASHLLQEQAAVDFDYTRLALPHLYVTREDGTVCSLLYDKHNGIAAWNTISVSSGAIRNTVSAAGDSGYDDIFFTVEKDGSYYLEKLTMHTAVYLDGFTEFTRETDLADFSDASVYIEEEDKLYLLAELPDSYKDFSKRMYIGYPYESIVESLPVVNDARNDKKRLVALRIRFLSSYLPQVCQSGLGEETIREKEPFSGVTPVPVQSSFEQDVFFKMRFSKPHGCTILAVYADLA